MPEADIERVLAEAHRVLRARWAAVSGQPDARSADAVEGHLGSMGADRWARARSALVVVDRSTCAASSVGRRGRSSTTRSSRPWPCPRRSWSPAASSLDALAEGPQNIRDRQAHVHDERFALAPVWTDLVILVPPRLVAKTRKRSGWQGRRQSVEADDLTLGIPGVSVGFGARSRRWPRGPAPASWPSRV